jgi:hypothetical protein
MIAPAIEVDRLLDPKNGVTLSSLQRAAAIVGRRIASPEADA